MRRRSRHGWHRVVNGVSAAALLVFLFIALPLYWLIASGFKTPAKRRSLTAGRRAPSPGDCWSCGGCLALTALHAHAQGPVDLAANDFLLLLARLRAGHRLI